jgi:hypothetical protein
MLILVFATASACGSAGSGRRGETPSAASSRVERCVDRLLRDTPTGSSTREAATRRYAREAYCAPFEQRGWVYDDGALGIAVQTWLDRGATCASAREGEPARTVPCEPERSTGGVRTLDCALLRIVRRSEARAYVDRLATNGPVACDDGTALDRLGVP